MTANPDHVRVRESSRGVSGIGGKLGIVDVACIGEEGSEKGGIESTSSEDDNSGDEGGSFGVGVTIDR
jgi:hypothetical protein